MKLQEAYEILRKHGYSCKKLNECGRGSHSNEPNFGNSSACGFSAPARKPAAKHDSVYDSRTCGYVSRAEKARLDYERATRSNTCGGIPFNKRKDGGGSVYDSGSCGYISRAEKARRDYERSTRNQCGNYQTHFPSDEEIAANAKRIDAWLNSPEQKAADAARKKENAAQNEYWADLKAKSAKAIMQGVKTADFELPDNMSINDYKQSGGMAYRDLRMSMTVDGNEWIVRAIWKPGEGKSAMRCYVAPKDSGIKIKGGRGPAAEKIENAIKPILKSVSDSLEKVGYFKPYSK